MPCAVKSHILEASRQPARPFGWLWMIGRGGIGLAIPGSERGSGRDGSDRHA